MYLEMFAFVIVDLNNLALTLVALIVNALFRSFDNITDDEGSQFVKLYYSCHTSWNEETEMLLLIPSNGTTPVQVLKQDDAKMKEYYNQIAHNRKRVSYYLGNDVFRIVCFCDCCFE
jgi:hypothetical protein